MNDVIRPSKKLSPQERENVIRYWLAAMQRWFSYNDEWKEKDVEARRLIEELLDEPKAHAHESNARRDSSACEQAWHSFANREPAPNHKDCFRGGWVAGKGYARDNDAHETLPPRITVMDDGRAMGGSDVCHTCEAHCTVINDLQTALRGLYWDNVDYLTLNKLGGMQNHWMRAARMALGMDVDDVRHSEKASESHGPVLTRVCPGCNTVHSGPLCPTESEGEDRG